MGVDNNTNQAGPAHRPSTATASSDFLRVIQDAATRAGLAPGAIYRRIGIGADVIEHRGKRVPIALARQAWVDTAKQSGDPLFGIHIAESMDHGSLDVLDGLVASSRTLGEAFRRLVRYGPLFSNAGEFSLVTTQDTARFVHRATGAVAWMSEMILAIVVLRVRKLCDHRWAPRGVGFMHERGGRQADYEALFQAPVTFGHPMDEVVFGRDLLERPIGVPDLHTTATLQAQADQALIVLPDTSTDFAALYQALTEAVIEGNPKIEVVADRLGISRRSLQRRLQEAGTSHRELVEHLRAQMAREQLTGGGARQSAVARTLGYANPSSFHRALARWNERSRAAGLIQPS
jgi:AraC-like DNA-binding protein